MIGRTEAIAQAGSASLDCWVQLTLPRDNCFFLRVDDVLILRESAIAFKKTLALSTAVLSNFVDLIWFMENSGLEPLTPTMPL